MQLDGPRAKVDRAVEHLEALKGECDRFLETQPFYVTAEFEADASAHVMRLRIQERLPLRLSAIVGDLIHNLRSALDHAVWLVACRSNPVEHLWQPPIAKQIYFPITGHPNEFSKHSIRAFIADDAKAVLEELQPYHGEDRLEDHPFMRLNRFWNIDKHRVLHGIFAALDLSRVSYRPAGLTFEAMIKGTVADWFPIHEGTLEDGTKIGQIHFLSGAPPDAVQVQMQGQPTAQIVFGGGGAGVSLGLAPLSGLVGHTAGAISRIAALPERPPA